MRCVCCDVLLSDFEATRKHAITGEYLDVCNQCLIEIPVDIPVIERTDLETNVEDIEDESGMAWD
jgi:hypothetical protein